ncbi:hypothetical protein AAP_06337 [Ascosphaera apis ARSEF 7405]|uniref:Vacuolar ATPase assembly protein VMA22 n=1 Tax=Ascosphaera apis ARSEF 7405 TaxID=392613 RepID=A0A167UVZ3_9EURO|nr:hypothetical protein AAP_06337 [Ascosphaera apis ARSEF 7405]
MPGTTVEDVDSISNHQPASIAAIDELLIRYLDLLDQYQKEQDKINRSFSSGFLCLARANLNSTSGHRYGQNYYDERMKALKTIEMEVHQNEHATEVYSLKLAPVHIDTPAASPAPSSANPSPDCEDLNNEDSAEKQDGESEKSDIDDKSTSQHDDGDDGEDTGKKSHTIDPIRWFGILVPQALRDAQSSFTKAVDDPILHYNSQLLINANNI